MPDLPQSTVEAMAQAIWTEVDGPLGRGVHPAEVQGHSRNLLRAEAALEAALDEGGVVTKQQVRSMQSVYEAARARNDALDANDPAALEAAESALDVALSGPEPPDATPPYEEVGERIALWLLNYNTRGTVTSFEGRPADHRTYLSEARSLLAAVGQDEVS